MLRNWLAVLLTGLCCAAGPAVAQRHDGAEVSDAESEQTAPRQQVPPAPRGELLLGPEFGRFILLPGGRFTMGCNDGEQEDERPDHIVTVSSFSIGATPVTVSQFVAFLNDAEITPQEYLGHVFPQGTRAISYQEGLWAYAPGTDRDAATCDSWALANRFCRRISERSGRTCRLPTEAEWEFACRGAEGRMFPWGDSEARLNERVWRWKSWTPRRPNRIPVGSMPAGATPEGVFDMVGYMDEMCSDWYDPEYYAKSPDKDPQGPSEPLQGRYETAKVTRGGLERPYRGYFHESDIHGFLPRSYLPRGYSRDASGGALLPPTRPGRSGRLGFRLVVEERAASE